MSICSHLLWLWYEITQDSEKYFYIFQLILLLFCSVKIIYRSNNNVNLIHKIWTTDIKFPLKFPLETSLMIVNILGDRGCVSRQPSRALVPSMLLFCTFCRLSAKLGRLVDCIGKTEQRKTSEAFTHLWSVEFLSEERLFGELSEVRGNTVWDPNSSCVFCFQSHPR